VVTDVSSGALSPASNGDQHLVGLSSLDEDSMGEEIQVVWQMEAGAQVLEKAGLPSITGWDSNDRLEAFLDAVRWGAVTNADRLFCNRLPSGKTIEDYQPIRWFEPSRWPVTSPHCGRRRWVKRSRRDCHPGATRPSSRQDRVRRLPPSLQVKWQTEMQEKFGLEFRIVDTEYVKRLRRERGIL
jgi:hypothetical protein